jgi:uncharacterized membrane protein YfcA
MDGSLVGLGALGVVAGVLTTVAGMGGGMLLVAVLVALRGPHVALALTTPALFVANGHRAWLFRKVLAYRIAGSFALGAVPAAALVGYFVPTLPGWVLAAILVFASILTLARSAGLVDLRPQRAMITAAGAGIGALAATAGGAGALTSPLFLAAGLTGTAYVGTVALAAVALHAGRLVGYGSGGMLSAELVPAMLVLLAGLLSGNLIGKRLRSSIDAQLEKRVEVGALLVCTGLAIVGVGR